MILGRSLVEQAGGIFYGRYGQSLCSWGTGYIPGYIPCFWSTEILTYVSGTVGAFEKWAGQVGDGSYSFSNILQYFQRSANFTPPNNLQRPANATAHYNASDWSPAGGPLQVGYSSWVNPVSSWLGLAFEELGLNELPSLLSGTLIGWGWLTVELDSDSQVRSSSEAFLREALEETLNLAVYKCTLAKQIIFESGSALGVTVDSGGVTYNISARKEVILSAGVVCAVNFVGSIIFY